MQRDGRATGEGRHQTQRELLQGGVKTQGREIREEVWEGWIQGTQGRVIIEAGQGASGEGGGLLGKGGTRLNVSHSREGLRARWGENPVGQGRAGQGSIQGKGRVGLDPGREGLVNHEGQNQADRQTGFSGLDHEKVLSAGIMIEVWRSHS